MVVWREELRPLVPRQRCMGRGAWGRHTQIRRRLLRHRNFK